MNTQKLALLALILSLFSLIGLGFSLWWLKSLNRLRQSFFAGQTGVDLETVIQALKNDLGDLRNKHINLEQTLKQLQTDFGFAIQKVGVVRFNPFADAGGNFSFCIALLNAKNSGIVITSMHGREQNRTYAKKILEGKSETRLTEEEQRAIQMADAGPEI